MDLFTCCWQFDNNAKTKLDNWSGLCSNLSAKKTLVRIEKGREAGNLHSFTLVMSTRHDARHEKCLLGACSIWII